MDNPQPSILLCEKLLVNLWVNVNTTFYERQKI